MSVEGFVEAMVLSEPREVGLYKSAYPGLIDDHVILLDKKLDLHRAQGLRVSRVFVAYSVEEENPVVMELWRNLNFDARIDKFPILLGSYPPGLIGAWRKLERD